MPTDLVGKVLNGRYEIVSFIGGGGQADVYMAIDITLNHEVAIKILKEQLALDPNSVLRLERDAQAGGSFNHRNLVEIYDLGYYLGLPYIVMQYIKGSTLKEVLKQVFQGSEQLDVDRVLDICIQLLEAVKTLHAGEKRHRDIKPANILIADDGTVKLIDFGIIKGVGDPDITDTGLAFGTPAYMSPEQARGQATTYASDLYSVGIVLYQMLTGNVPFQGSVDQVLAKQANPDLEPKPPNIYNSKISPNLNSIVMKALEKDAALRYQSAEKMRDDLRAEYSQLQKQRESESQGNAQSPFERSADKRPPLRIPVPVVPHHSNADHNRQNRRNGIAFDPSHGPQVAAQPVEPVNGPRVSPADDQAARQLFAGRFRLVRKLHEDEITEVWSARDEQLAAAGKPTWMAESSEQHNEPRLKKSPQSRVVLKVIREDKKSDEVVQRAFAAEIDSLFGLKHHAEHNLPVPRARGTSQDQRLYIAFEDINARGTRESLEQPRLGCVFEVAWGVARALSWMHQNGLAHGGISIDNVIVVKWRDELSKEHLSATLLDFGLARRISQSDGLPVALLPGEQEALRLVYSAPRDLGYAAPEQLSGNLSDCLPSRTSDIYSVGALLYKLLTGETPYSGETPDEIAHAMSSSTPRPLASYPGPPPDEFAAIVYKCLEHQPSQRYESVEELLQALSQYKALAEGPTDPGDGLETDLPIVQLRPRGGIDFGVVGQTSQPISREITVVAHSQDLDPEDSKSAQGEIYVDAKAPGSAAVSLSRRGFPVDGETTIVVTLDGRILPVPGDYSLPIRFKTPEMDEPVPVVCRVQARSGLDLLLVIDRIGKPKMLEQRKEVAIRLLQHLEQNQDAFGGLRAAVISYADHPVTSAGAPALQMFPFGSPAEAYQMLQDIQHDLGTSAGFEAALDEAIGLATGAGRMGDKKIEWGKYRWGAMVTFAGRPPYPMVPNPSYSRQSGSRHSLNWQSMAEQLRGKLAVLSIVVDCGLYWPDGVRFPMPSYAQAYADECWKGLSSVEPLLIDVVTADPTQLPELIEERFFRGSATAAGRGR